MTQIVGPRSAEAKSAVDAQLRVNPRLKYRWVEWGHCACGKNTSMRYTSKEEAEHFKAQAPLVFHCASCRAKDKLYARREMVSLCLRLEARKAEIKEEQRRRA